MLTVAEIVEEAGAPAGSVSILPMSRALGDRLVADDRFAVLSFTGSPAVGWPMKARAGKKRVVLELGGNAGAIVDRSADLDWAVRRITVGAFSYSGQVCISVQRVFVHDDVFDEFADRLVAAARALRLGDPLDPETDLGPMVDAKAAARTQAWVDEAVAAGARLLLGGHAEDTFYPPTILVDAPLDAKVCSEEAFAPLVVLARFSDFEAAVSQANDRGSGSRRASSRTTWGTRSGPSTASRSAASSSTTSRPTGSTTCRTAGSRIPGTAARGCATPSRT